MTARLSAAPSAALGAPLILGIALSCSHIYITGLCPELNISQKDKFLLNHIAVPALAAADKRFAATIPKAAFAAHAAGSTPCPFVHCFHCSQKSMFKAEEPEM